MEFQSPIWIWFDKNDKNVKTATCKICKTNVVMGNASTTNLITHLKRHHGFLKKYSAFKVDRSESTSAGKENREKWLMRFIYALIMLCYVRTC